MNGDDVRAAARACTSFLRSFADRDWRAASVPELDWVAWDALDHVFAGTLWYGLDLAAGDTQVEAMQVGLRASATPADALASLEAAANLLAHAVDGLPDSWRGYHPFGWADASGFAAMECDELLVHTDDVARAFAERFTPDAALCERVVRRLFPWAPSHPVDDAWDVLLWANGRRDHSGAEPVPAAWRWHSAPLDEWDGTNPNAS
jgi:hypothetical protein